MGDAGVDVIHRETAAFFGAKYDLVRSLQLAQVVKRASPLGGSFKRRFRRSPVCKRRRRVQTRKLPHPQHVGGVRLRSQPASGSATMCEGLHRYKTRSFTLDTRSASSSGNLEGAT